MKTKPANRTRRPVIVPVDDETRAMLAYADSPEGRAKIENARQEFRDGKGIEVTPRLFEDLDHRVAERVAQARATKK
ncbi:MAG: hypothetical protein ACLQIQ_00275 [Beijerinckiaceae bacterium]